MQAECNKVHKIIHLKTISVIVHITPIWVGISWIAIVKFKDILKICRMG